MCSACRGRTDAAAHLEGITVVALEQAVAAPFATRQLADLGARVIKVERPGRRRLRARLRRARCAGMSSHFVWLNRSKESLTLDLKQPDGATILQRLLERADVFIQNLAPGAAERLGFGADALREQHPRLIVCDISGYGTDGPYRDKKAYDLLIQCETGVPVAHRHAGRRRPRPASRSPTSPAACTPTPASWPRSTSASGPARAQRSRSRCFDALAEWMGYPALLRRRTAARRRRAPAPAHATIAPYGPFPARRRRRFPRRAERARVGASSASRCCEQPRWPRDPRFASNAGARRASAHALRRRDRRAVSQLSA